MTTYKFKFYLLCTFIEGWYLNLDLLYSLSYDSFTSFCLVDVDCGHFISVEIYLYGENVINQVNKHTNQILCLY